MKKGKKMILFGHTKRRDNEYIGGEMMEKELPDRRKRGRPKRRRLRKLVGGTEEDGECGVK